MNQHGVVIAAHGAAIVTVERRPGDAVVTGIEPMPFNLDVMAARIEELAQARQDRFVIDAEGLGSALWAVVAPEQRGGLARHVDPRWSRYDGRGLERQALVDRLVVAVHDETLHFAPGLAAQGAMTTGLLSYRRQVREDGLIGSELVVALCLAILEPPARKGGWAFVA